MSYRVLMMCQQDIAQVTEIDREAFPTMMPPANFLRELRSSLAYYIVAYDDEKTIDEPESEKTGHYIVGFAGFWVIAGEAHIVNIAVQQSYRRWGIGELLLISLMDLAVELKAYFITLEVRTSNIAAQSLYYKYGFALKGLRHGYYSDDKEDAVIMTLENIDSAPFQEQLNRLKQAHYRKWGAPLYQVAR